MRYLEDFSEGDRFVLGPRPVSEADIVGLAQQYDPQPFHTEATHPRTQAMGGLLASGWHSAALFMAMAVDAYMADAAIMTSPGVDKLRWLAPLRPGDTLHGEVIITGVRRSQSKPDRGILTTSARLWQQAGIDVLSLDTTAFVASKSTQPVSG